MLPPVGTGIGEAVPGAGSSPVAALLVVLVISVFVGEPEVEVHLIIFTVAAILIHPRKLIIYFDTTQQLHQQMLRGSLGQGLFLRPLYLLVEKGRP